MQATVFLALSSFLFCLALTPIVRAFSNKYRLVDHPDAQRKLHFSPIPRTGGVAILLACVAALALVTLPPIGSSSWIDLPLILGVLPAARPR